MKELSVKIQPLPLNNPQLIHRGLYQMLIPSDSRTRCWAIFVALACGQASAETSGTRAPVLCETVADAIASTVDGRRSGLRLEENLALAGKIGQENEKILTFIEAEITAYYHDTTVMPTPEMHNDQKELLRTRSLLRCYRSFGTD